MNAFSGFDDRALALLAELPRFDTEQFAAVRPQLRAGVQQPGAALIEAVARSLDADLTVDRRSSVSPLHRDLRFAKPGTPRYKDHLLLTAWHGRDKKTSPTVWLRLDANGVGFASGLVFTPEQRKRWRSAVAGAPGERLAEHLDVLKKRHRRHDVDVAATQLTRVPKPWSEAHPRADLLRFTSLQVRFRLPLPSVVAKPGFAEWCAAPLRELLPVHEWLVGELGAPRRPPRAGGAPRGGAASNGARRAPERSSAGGRARAGEPMAAGRTASASVHAALFWKLAGELQAADPRVAEGTIMKSRCLRVAGEFLALVDLQGSGLVVKLPRPRVQELIAQGVGRAFAPAGKVFREWLSVPAPDGRRWRKLLREGIDHVAGT